jgi:DNA-binding NarL/FixJ family response regulator
MKPVTVFVVDDHAMLCEAVMAFLEGDPEIEVLGCETNSRRAVERLVSLRPDVVLLDLKMPHKDGAAILQEAKSQLPSTHFMIMSGDIATEQALELMRAGASGVVLKTTDVDSLRNAVKSVAAGELWLERRHLAAVVRRLARPRRDWESISARELDIVQCVAAQLSNKEIAERLSISEDTVKSHLKVIFRKLGLSNRGDLRERARTHGLGGS